MTKEIMLFLEALMTHTQSLLELMKLSFQEPLKLMDTLLCSEHRLYCHHAHQLSLYGGFLFQLIGSIVITKFVRELQPIHMISYLILSLN